MGSRVHEYKFHCPLKFVDLFLYLEVEKMLIYFVKPAESVPILKSKLSTAA